MVFNSNTFLIFTIIICHYYFGNLFTGNFALF